MEHPSAEPGGHGRARALDGLRGIAAVAVVIYHAILHNDLSLIQRVLLQPIQTAASWRDGLTKLALSLFDGEAAVYLFFVLSGCVLRLSLARQGDVAAPRLGLSFALARAIRLYPPVIATMLLIYALGWAGAPGVRVFAPWELLANATLWATPMHGPSYTIQLELMAVPFILIAWLARRRFGIVGLVLCLVWGMMALETGWMVGFLPNMHAFLVAFMAGMLVAEPQLGPVLAEAPAGAWWAALAGVLLTRVWEPHVRITGLIGMAMCATLLVGGLLHGRRGSLHAALEGRLAQRLGRVSFSLYLLSVPVLYVLWGWTDRWAWVGRHALEMGLVVGVVAVGVTYPLAWASERWVERPAVLASRRVADRVLRRDMVLAGE